MTSWDCGTRRGPRPGGGVQGERGRGPGGCRPAAAERRWTSGEPWGIDDVANYLGVPKQTVYSWRKTGYRPTAIRVGKHLRWRDSVVLEWTLAQERGN